MLAVRQMPGASLFIGTSPARRRRQIGGRERHRTHVGRRTGTSVNGTTTGYLYDGANLVQELSGGTPTANMLTGLGIDEIFSRTDSIGTSSFLTDALVSTIALADSSGTIQTSYTYDPFGNPTVTGATSSNTQQYTGRENDGTGLQYNRARHYSPTLQRFISEDPLGFGGGDVNLYAYVGNDPINATDPSGMQQSGLDPGGLASAVTGRQSHGRQWVNGRTDYAPVAGSPFDVGPLIDGAAEAGIVVSGTALLLLLGILNSDVATIRVSDLKKIRTDWIDQMGGEDVTADLKKEYGGSLSDLYCDPETGNIYAVRKGAREVPRDEIVANLKDYEIRWK